MYYFIKTFGCQMNENDSGVIASILRDNGYFPCASSDGADIIIVNTCCVRQSAENRALGFIGSLKSLKEQRPDRIIAVCGCMSQKPDTAELLQKKYRHIDIITGTFATTRLAQYIEAYAATGERIVDIEERYNSGEIEHICTKPFGEGGYRAQVNINFGCNNFCSYCIVPYVRGRERSISPDEIIRQIKLLAESGVKEVQLLGQNVNAYGKDSPESGWDFSRLLRAVHQINGIERIRYMTSHPRDFNRHLAETIVGLPKVCPHFHLPVQSGCDRILELMNRGYTTVEYLEKLEMIRELTPDATITSDIIVGFPGETEADFQQTLDFIREAHFDAAYTFIYSRRTGTPAADMPGHLSTEVKTARLQRLMAVQNPISLALNEKLIGTVQEIMVDGISKNRSNMLSGRTAGSKITVFPISTGLNPGDLVRIRITAARTWNLYGVLSKNID